MPYEQRRISNMQRNAARLHALGLAPCAPRAAPDKRKRTPSPAREGTASPAPTVIPRGRVRGGRTRLPVFPPSVQLRLLVRAYDQSLPEQDCDRWAKLADLILPGLFQPTRIHAHAMDKGCLRYVTSLAPQLVETWMIPYLHRADIDQYGHNHIPVRDHHAALGLHALRCLRIAP